MEPNSRRWVVATNGIANTIAPPTRTLSGCCQNESQLAPEEPATVAAAQKIPQTSEAASIRRKPYPYARMAARVPQASRALAEGVALKMNPMALRSSTKQASASEANSDAMYSVG